MIDEVRSEPQTPPQVVEDLVMMSQLPLIFFCDWWSTALRSFSRSCAPEHQACAEEDEGQLVVPEPIEVEGEHALFA